MTRDEYYKAREIREEIGELDLYRSKLKELSKPDFIEICMNLEN